MKLTICPLTKRHAQAMLTWCYPEPYNLYNPVNSQETLTTWLNPTNQYRAILNDRHRLVAFCCFGNEAQVLGGNYETEALDIGLGVHPNLTGQGQGRVYVQSVLKFAIAQFDPVAFRVTVAQFNQRALRVWHQVGFQHQQTFCKVATHLQFTILTKIASKNKKGNDPPDNL